MLTAKFIISNLFTSQSGDIDIQKKDLNETGHIVVSAGLSNCGVIGKTNKKAKIMPANSITVDMFGNAFYRDEEYKITTHARVFALLPKFTMTKEIGLYISACMKYFQKKFSYSNMCSWKKICDLTLILPVQVNETGKPIIDSNKQFDSNGYFPDWNYMQDYIEKLEQEHISELEMELDAYLKATSLNDYELTEDDKRILASKLTKNGEFQADNIIRRSSVSGFISHVGLNPCSKSGNESGFAGELSKNEDGKEPAKESEPMPEGRWWKDGREFIFSDLFTSQTGDTDIQKKDINGKGCYVVSAGLSNHGIIGKTDREAKVIDKNTITVDMFGNAFYRDTDYKMVTHARVFALSPKFEMTESSGLYMTSCMSYLTKKFAYSNMCSWNKIQNLPICLPIQTDDSGKPVIDAGKTYSPKGYIPDWEYMEKYIKATEKEIIKEVVLYKDKVIAKAKEIAGEKEVA